MKSASTGLRRKAPKGPPQAVTDDFITRYGVAIIVGLGCVLRAWQAVFVPVSPQQDVTAYFTHASQWLQGLVPYTQFALEYPPGALPIWTVPRLFAASFEAYRKAFAVWMGAFDVATCVLVWRAVVEPRAKVLAALVYLLGTAMLGSLLLQRYDPVLGFLLMAWWTAARRPGGRLWADAALALGIWVKLMAVLMVPIYWLYLCAGDTQAVRQAGTSSLKACAAWLRGAGARRIAALLALTTLLFLPFYVQSGDALGSFFTYHRDRGVQLETIYASFFLLLRPWLQAPVEVTAAFGAIEVLHPWAQAVAKSAAVLTVAALLATVGRFGVQLFAAPSPPARNALLGDGAVAMLVAFMAFNKVLSPQYLLWLAPLAALSWAQTRSPWRAALFSAVFIGTGLTWLFYYPQLFAMHSWPIWVMALRNGAFFALWVSLLGVPWPRLTLPARLAAPHPALVSVTTGIVLLAWGFCVNLSLAPGDDIGLRLAEGADIFARRHFGSFGAADSAMGSALAVPHAGVSSALLYAAQSALGDGCISWMAAVLACVTLFCMACAPGPIAALTPARLAGLTAAAYVVFLRALNWPDALSLALFAALVWTLDSARRHAHGRTFAALVILQALLTNTDPRAVMAAVLIVAVACVTCAQTRDRATQLRWAAAAAAVMAATCANPDGATVWTRFDIFFGNPFARAWLTQWAPPFAQSIWFYWPWLFAGVVGVSVLGMAARLQQRPWVDAAVLVLAIASAWQASVWVGFATLMLWPVMARGIDACVRVCALDTYTRWPGLALTSLLLINAVTYGYGVSDADHRVPMQAGLGGDLPYAAVNTLDQLHVQGTLFNEFTDGGVVMRKLSPQMRPVIDSRLELFSNDMLQDYQAAYTDVRAFAPYVDKHHVTAVLLHRGRAFAPVLQWLEQDPGWMKLNEVDNRALFLRRNL